MQSEAGRGGGSVSLPVHVGPGQPGRPPVSGTKTLDSHLGHQTHLLEAPGLAAHTPVPQGQQRSTPLAAQRRVRPGKRDQGGDQTASGSALRSAACARFTPSWPGGAGLWKTIASVASFVPAPPHSPQAAWGQGQRPMFSDGALGLHTPPLVFCHT